MAASVVDICNQALYLLGHDPITALDDGTRRANLCNLLWPEVRDAVLADHPWNCAVVRDELAQDATDPEFGYENRFALPTDPYCLRVLSTDQDKYMDENGQQAYPWEIEGRFLVINTMTVKIKYVARVIDVTQYSPKLVTAIAAKLAAELAFPITKNNGVRAQMEELYDRKIAEAKIVDAQEGTPLPFESNALWNARL